MKELFDDLTHLRWRALFVEPTVNPALQFFRYAFVGGFAAIVDWAALYLLTLLGLHYMVSAVFAFIAGLLVNYALSKRIVFNAEKPRVGKAAEFAGYAITGGVGLGLTELILYLLTEKAGLHFIVSKIIATAVVLVWNYLSRKLLLYGKD